MFDCFVGIDISKDFERRGGDRERETPSVSQTEKGFQGLRWLQKIGVENALFCRKPPGAYYMTSLIFLFHWQASLLAAELDGIRRFAQRSWKEPKQTKSMLGYSDGAKQ